MLWTTLISICLVFGILVLLVWIMKLFGMIFVSRRKAAAAATQSGQTPSSRANCTKRRSRPSPPHSKSSTAIGTTVSRMC